MARQTISGLTTTYEAALREKDRELAAAKEALAALKKEAEEFIKDNQGEICSGMMDQIRESFTPHGISVPGVEGGISVTLTVRFTPEDDTFPASVTENGGYYNRVRVTDTVERALKDAIDECIQTLADNPPKLKELLGGFTIEAEDFEIEFNED